MLICITGVHSSFRINKECLKRHNMHFKNVILKDSFDDLKSALDSCDLPNRITTQLWSVGRTQKYIYKTNMKSIKSINHKVIKLLGHLIIQTCIHSISHSGIQGISHSHSAIRSIGNSATVIGMHTPKRVLFYIHARTYIHILETHKCSIGRKVLLRRGG